MAIVEGVLYDKGGAVFNVKHSDFGAVGDGTTDDTLAIQAAITAATLQLSNNAATAVSAKGSIVYFPMGIYKISSTLHLSSGVSIRGAGMRTTQLKFYLSTGDDGLVWDQGNETSPYHVGAFLEDIDLMTAGRDTTGQSARDLVVLQSWQSFSINRARIYAAYRNNLLINDSVNITAVHLESYEAGQSNLYVGSASSEGYTTTARFVGCYFQGTQDGPGADVAGYGLSFEQCIFESCGRRTPAGAYGVRVRWGTAAFVSPYFENNRDWELIAGTEAPSGAQETAVTVINPVFTPASNKLTGKGGVRFERGSATLVGGNYGTGPHPMSFSTAMNHVFVSAKSYPNAPEVDAPGSLKLLPGTVLYTDPPSGQWIVTGAAGYEIGGGDLIKKHLSTTAAWTPGVVANGATAQVVVTVAGASYGDTVVVSFNHQGAGLGSGVILFGSVSGSGNAVAVTLLNVSGSSLTFLSGTLRVDVWKH
ncbi:MAG TPA: glycosyl hydrolase family 28-related protein [Longimicrobium sp.]|nr:glycosyl hydrolase family 28-related protein [Longimicrobium sp.]